MARKNEGTGPSPQLMARTYSDGHPLDEVHYLECKLILKPDHFVDTSSFHDYTKLVRRAAEKNDIEFSAHGFKDLRPRIREVVFFDTKDFSLYNHAFILRRRIAYDDGFPVGDPEIVFKFRHPNLKTAAERDVRPSIPGRYRIKFKAEALPLKDKLGGLRLLYSHNVEFGLSQVHEVDRTSLSTLCGFFPVLATLPSLGAKRVDLVNHMIVEEVLKDLGELDFGKGVTAKSNAALWRQRGDHKSLIGEFSFECKFKRKNELHDKPMERCKRFFVTLQEIAREWVSLGSTKTGVVYRLKGNPPHAHE
ncbi:MAG TPA: hypothetical protein VGI47_02180 [Candidatus Binataceae bacterium]